MTNFSVATSESWRDKGSGEMQERTEWHNVVCFARLAEIAGEYLRKGSKVYIEGSLRTSSWEQEGQKKYRTEIMAKELQMLDARGGGMGGGDNFGGPPADSYGGGAPSASGGAMRSGGGSGGGAPSAGGPGPAPVSDEDFDDDIPF